MRRNGSVRGGNEQSSRHPKMHNPLRLSFAARVRSQIANNMLADATHAQEDPSIEPRGLPSRQCLEGLPMPAKPDFDNAVATHSLLDAAGNGFYLRQFRQRSIVEDRVLRYRRIIRQPPPWFFDLAS